MPTQSLLRRGPGRPTGPVSIEERRRRLAAINRCASYSDEIIDLNVRIMRDENEPSSERRAAGKWLWESAFGRPVQPIAESSEGTVRHIYNVRWLPPDPNDHSKVIEPERD
jgi:hypothetical protein